VGPAGEAAEGVPCLRLLIRSSVSETLEVNMPSEEADRLTIEENARRYILRSYRNMASVHFVWSEEFPEDAAGDRKANPTNIGDIIDVNLGSVRDEQGHLTVPFSFSVPADIHFPNSSALQAGVVQVSGELWGQTGPSRGHLASSDDAGDNPNVFRYKADLLTSTLVRLVHVSGQPVTVASLLV
jgi:hypothetical protein